MKADVKNNISKYVFYVLIAIALLVLFMFVFKFDEANPNDELFKFATERKEPLALPYYTDWLLYSCYGFTALAAVLIICFMVVRYAKQLADNPKAALKSSIPVLLLIVLVAICWMQGSSELDTIVYSGADLKAAEAAITAGEVDKLTNVDVKAIAEGLPFNLKLTDAVLYAQYVLVALAVLTTCASLLIGAIKNKNK